MACIGDTKAQIFLSDKDTYEKVVYSNTALFHLQARVYLARIATRLQPTTSIIRTTTTTTNKTTTTSSYLSPRLYPSDMVGACDRSGVAIAIVKTTLQLQDRVT